MEQKSNSDQISSGAELSQGELDMIEQRAAEENEKIFEFLDEVLPENSPILESSNHAKELYDAFRTERFQKCSDLKYLNKAIQWLNALQGEILVFFRGKGNTELLAALVVLVGNENLKEEVNVLVDAVSELITKYVQICKDVTSRPPPQSEDPDSKNLQKYIDRAITMRQDKTIKKYCEDVIKSMTQYFQTDGAFEQLDYDFSQHLKTDSRLFPFWIICSSSGTGKSQFAYTLPMPIVYMLMESSSKSTCQDIYSPFISISDQFQTVLTEDYNNFQKIHPAEEKLSVDNLLKANRPRTKMAYRYSTIGFIVDLLEKMVNYKNSDPNRHWLECQHAVTTVRCVPLTIKEGHKRLYEMRTKLPTEDADLPFVFVFDECQFSAQNTNSKNRFRFVRNLMRAIRICFVAMGTNASACNFTDNVGKTSRDTTGTWCHLIFKLPTVAGTVLESVIQETKVEISKVAKEKDLSKLTSEFIDSFFELFRNSRPLFLHYAFKFICESLKEWNEESFANFFQKILRKINIKFFEAKHIVDNSFIIGQFTYFTMKYWMGVNRRVLALQKYSASPPGLINDEKLRDFFCGAGLVNQHLAYVGLPLRLLGKNDIVMLDIYTHKSDLTTESLDSGSKETKGLGYRINSSDNVFDFHHYSRYLTCNEEPLVGLAFSIHQHSFPPSKTTFNALVQILSDERCRSFMNDSSKFNGYLLELAVTTACVVSSHAKEFNGMKFRDWLPRFFDELNFFDFVAGKNDKYELICSQEFLDNWGDIDIPYFCPQVSFDFSSDLVKMIRRIEPSFNPGSVNCNFDEKNESRDFHFTANGKVILNGECKLRENNLDISELKEIIEGFESFDYEDEANMHIVVAKSIAEFRSEDIPDDYLIYKAKFIQNMETEEENELSSGELSAMTIEENLAKKSKSDSPEPDEATGKQVPQESSGYVIERIFPKPMYGANQSREGSPLRPSKPLKFTNKKVIILVGLCEIAQDKYRTNDCLDYFKR